MFGLRRALRDAPKVFERTMDRRRMLGAAAATVAGAAVGTVAGATSAGAQTTSMQTGTLVFSPNEHSKSVAVTGLTSGSRAFATQQSPLASKVGSAAPVLTAHPDRNTGLLTIEINDGVGGGRWWTSPSRGSSSAERHWRERHAPEGADTAAAPPTLVMPRSAGTTVGVQLARP